MTPNIPPELQGLETELARRGFREARRERWGAGEGIRQYITYERDGLNIGLAFDEDWEIAIAATRGGGDPRNSYGAPSWAIWLDRPLRNPASWREQVQFVRDNIDLLQSQVGNFDRKRMDEILQRQARI